MTVNDRTVAIGVDAAVVADHQVAVRGLQVREDFRVSPNLAGLSRLSERLSPYAGSLVVAEPTAGTWLPLGWAVTDAGCGFALVQNRQTARLRQAVAGKNKTDAVDADMLAGCEALFGLEGIVLPSAHQMALRRALRRRHQATVATHSTECRLWALGAWAFPDVWRACGGHTVAQPVLSRWQHLRALARARIESVAEVVATHSRKGSPARRAERIRDAARGWVAFWSGRLDLDALAWEVGEMLEDISVTEGRIARARDMAETLWRENWPGDLLTTVSGIGPICAAATRAYFGEQGLASAKAAAAFVGLNPSNWESGLSASPSRPITKEGPPELRLAYYQAANVARRHDPQLAAHYRTLMVERRHNHIKANCAVARKLVCRAWAVLDRGEPYEIRDLEGRVIDQQTATALAAELAVPEDVRRRSRAQMRRGRLSE